MFAGITIPIALATGAVVLPVERIDPAPVLTIGFAWLPPLLWGVAALVAVLLLSRAERRTSRTTGTTDGYREAA
jgi:hypothetical protein